MPSATRPARPLRCVAMSMLMRTVSRWLSPVRASNIICRHSPESTTTLTPSIVSDVSAIGVASTTLRSPSLDGAIALYCCWGGRLPYRGITLVGSSAEPSSCWQRSISPCPGRNTRMSPLCRLCASIVADAAICEMSRRSAFALAYLMSTSNIRPSLSMSGAFSKLHILEASIVADIMTILMSGRIICCVWRVRARARSELMLRS